MLSAGYVVRRTAAGLSDDFLCPASFGVPDFIFIAGCGFSVAVRMDICGKFFIFDIGKILFKHTTV